MLLECSGVRLEVIDEFVSLSPYISRMRGMSPITNMNHLNLADLTEYVKYINGENFNINEEFFKSMGTSNTYHYPLDFWKIKLIDTRLRDFHETIMKYDPYAGLTEINFNRKRFKAVMENITDEPHLFIAGGAALYIADITDRYHDVDIFTTDFRSVNKIAKSLDGETAYISEHALTIGRAQYILRKYKYISQIPHGFDVGCCGVVIDIDNEKCYITNRAKYCIDNKVNWLEPDRSSPTYIKRLCKYAARGFKIMLPMINNLYLNTRKITGIKLEMIYENEGLWYAPMDIPISDLMDFTRGVNVPNEVIDELRKYDSRITLSATELASNSILRELVAFYTLDTDDNAFALTRYNNRNDRKDFTQYLPTDEPSALILMACLGIYSIPKYYKSEDYGSNYDEYDGSKLVWTEIDPMKQLTGTFHVENINDLLHWYKSSSIVSTNDTIPIVTKQQKDHPYISIELMD